MRTMMRIMIPVGTGNKTVKDGTIAKVMGSAMEKLRPEAAYFYTENGKRTALMVFDLKNPSEIPIVVEPFFMDLEAEITLTPVMNADDLKKGLEGAMKNMG